jgi:hypothetical protein
MNKQEWVAVVECHFCKSVTPTKECFRKIVPVIKSSIYKDEFENVMVCKECHRGSQLDKLLGEKHEKE